MEKNGNEKALKLKSADSISVRMELQITEIPVVYFE